MTTPRENLLKVFSHQVPDWIPIVGHVDPYNRPSMEGMGPELREMFAKVEWSDESTVNFSRHLGIDIMEFFAPPIRITRPNVTVESVEQGDTTTNIWHTPLGDLREVIRTCRAGPAVSSNRLEHMVKGPEDIATFASIFEDEVVEMDPDGLWRVRERRQLVGDDGMMMYFMPGTPLGMMYRFYSGVATLAYLWADAPDALGDLFKTMEESYLRQFRFAAESEGDILVGMDDTSTTAISPAMFERFNIDLTNRRARLSHEHGKLYFHHSCGLIRDLLPLYSRTQMDAVHAYTQPPVGDATIADGRGLLGGKVTIITGIGAMAGPGKDRDATRSEIERMMREAAPWDHFIIGVAAYPDTTIEETQFIVDCCKEAQCRMN
ncbi:MAG: uroporphyrinogen decarboxylase family protein [Planctomycetota bacterium]|jgi:hypothetical protein